MNIDIINFDYHRNGISGHPFKVYLIEDYDYDDLKVVIMFDDSPDHVAVLSIPQLAKGDISFGSNSWRGDAYAVGIRQFLESAVC